MNKGLLIPVFTYLAAILKQQTGYELPNEVIDSLATLILFIIPAIGFFMNPKKKEVVTVETGNQFTSEK